MLPKAKQAEADRKVSEIQFHLPPGADLWIDDVLLYEPAENAAE
jgi:hypothetical protein